MNAQELVKALQDRGLNVSWEYPGFIAPTDSWNEETGYYAWTVAQNDAGDFELQSIKHDCFVTLDGNKSHQQMAEAIASIVAWD